MKTNEMMSPRHATLYNIIIMQSLLQYLLVLVLKSSLVEAAACLWGFLLGDNS